MSLEKALGSHKSCLKRKQLLLSTPGVRIDIDPAFKVLGNGVFPTFALSALFRGRQPLGFMGRIFGNADAESTIMGG